MLHHYLWTGSPPNIPLPTPLTGNRLIALRDLTTIKLSSLHIQNLCIILHIDVSSVLRFSPIIIQTVSLHKIETLDQLDLPAASNCHRILTLLLLSLRS